MRDDLCGGTTGCLGLTFRDVIANDKSMVVIRLHYCAYELVNFGGGEREQADIV